MYTLGVQYEKQNGPDAVRQYKVTFTVDESQRESLFEWLKDAEKGSSWLMLLFNTEEEEGNIENMISETPKQMKKRFQKRMYALINNKATEYKKEPEEIKEMVKDYLIQKGYMKKSSKELSVKGYAAAIYYLQSEF